MLVIKYWAKKNAVCKAPHALSTYGWSLLFIAYLQSLRVANGDRLVPTVHQVQQQTAPQHHQEVLHLRVDFNLPSESVVLPDDWAFSRLGILAGFFKYYAEFPFGAKVVSPFSGEPIDIELNIEASANPDRLSKARRRCVEKFKATRKHFVGTVQGPLNHNSVLTASRKTLTRIRELLANASRICQGYLQSGIKESLLLEELFSCTIDQNGNTKRTKGAAATVNIAPYGGPSLSAPGLPKYGFLVYLNANPYLSPDQFGDRAASKIRDIFEKIMTFLLTPTELTDNQGVVARKFKCTPITPPAWQFLGKRIMGEYISQIPDVSQQEFISCFKKMMMSRRVRFRFLRQKREREFFCFVTLREGFCVEVTFEPCGEDGIGFARHVSNYLRTSLGPWLNDLP